MDSLEPWDDEVWNGWALAAFHHQYEGCTALRSWWSSRGATPDSIVVWRDVPPVPAEAFKYFDFRSPDDMPAEAVFVTSGTSAGPGRRGRHHVPSLDLYRASMIGPMRAALAPDGGAFSVVSLVPDAEQRSDSSLSFMVSEGAAHLSTDVYSWVDGDGAWVNDEFERFDQRGHDRPVMMLTTALALAHLLETPDRVRTLPPGSVVMETGGFKGVRDEISRDGLYARVTARLGVPAERIVNEYGMTELLSQLWEPVRVEGIGARGVHVPPPWLRVRALDPDTLAELPEGSVGLLAFYDVANYGSVSHVVTQDLGSVIGGRVRLQGRVLGSEPRGCSRAMDELMAARTERS